MTKTMMTSTNDKTCFVRKTQLAGNEYHKNFYKLDREIMTSVTSPEADRVTPLMSKIYLKLVNAPYKYFEREGVLRFEAEYREGKQTKAWDVLREVLGVASATANKALSWLHDVGIIGYFAGKNGVGIRIFLNRAASSIGIRETIATGQKNLHSARTSSSVSHASPGEPAFNVSYAVKETLDKDLNPHAPQNGANTQPREQTWLQQSQPIPPSSCSVRIRTPNTSETRETREATDYVENVGNMISLDDLTRRLQSVLEPSLRASAIQVARNEHERTREWLEKSGIPKAVRVAQRESYNVLRTYGLVDGKWGSSNFKDEVGRSFLSSDGARDGASESEAMMTASLCHTGNQKRLSEAEILDLAEACVALLETQGKPIEVTLQEITGGVEYAENCSYDDDSKLKKGWLSVTDANRVRALTKELIGGKICEPATNGSH